MKESGRGKRKDRAQRGPEGLQKEQQIEEQVVVGVIGGGATK